MWGLKLLSAALVAQAAAAFVPPAALTTTTMMASSTMASAPSSRSSSGVRLVPTTPSPPSQAGLGQKFFLGNFLPPYGLRDTIRTQVSDDIFLFEQAQTFVNVSVNIRSTVIRMK